MKAIVIGAGFGGLASSLALAAKGFDVTVVEAGPRVGGKAGIAEVDGVSFDTGPSTLTLPAVVDAVFAAAGLRREDYVALRQLDHTFRYHFDTGVQLDVFGDLDHTRDSVRETLGPSAARELMEMLSYARTIWETAAPAFVFNDAPSLRTMASPAMLLQIPGMRHIDPLRSMWDALTARVKTPELQALFARYATYNGSDPRRAPATLHCISWVEMGLGAYGVEGGMHALPLGIAEAARRMGVSFVLGRNVVRIEQHRGSVKAVHLDQGERLAADVIVSNADVHHLFGDLLDDHKPPRGQISTSGWTAVIRARKSTERAAHNVIFPHDYLGEFRDLFDHERPPTQPTVYVCDQHLAHQRPGWDAHVPLFVMVNAPAMTTDDARHNARDEVFDAIRERVMGRLLEHEVIDPDDEVVWQRTPARLAERFPGSFGSIYGMASNAPWSAFLRTPNRVRGVQGLYVATGSAHPGGGVPMCLLSGLLAARSAVQDTLGAAQASAIVPVP